MNFTIDKYIFISRCYSQLYVAYQLDIFFKITGEKLNLFLQESTFLQTYLFLKVIRVFSY